MTTNYNGFGLKIQIMRLTVRDVWFCIFITLWTFVPSTDAVTLTGSSEYAVPGVEFTLTCDVPEEAVLVQFYRRPDVTIPVGSIQVAGGLCYNTITSPAVPCTADVCSCVTSGGNLGTVFRWIIQPQTGDQGSVWFCSRTNLNLPNQDLDSDDYTLNLADGPGTSISLSSPDTIYTRTEGDTLPDITCTADCRPGCTFVWTRPDNANFTVSPVLSLEQLDRSEHGTYRCTARNVAGESTISMHVTVQSRMPNTKVTKRKPGMACPLCFARFGTQEAWETHLIMCGKETREKKQFECPHCDFATARQILLNRHVARRHGPSPKDDTGDDSDWLRTDPGSLPQFTGAVSGTDHESRDLEIGRTFSKPTRPMPVSAPKRCKTNEGGGFLPKESLISLLSPAVLGEKDTFCSSKGSVASVSAPAEPTQDGTRGTVDKCMESQGDRRSISTQTTAQPRRRTNKVTTTKFVDGMQIVSEEITEWDEYVD